MRHEFFISRGLLSAVLVFLLAACTAATPPPAPKKRSLAAAVEALRVGDLPRLRTEQAKGAGLAAHASVLAQRLNPDAWLVAMGGSAREHDLAAAAVAMAAGDDSALADAMGFSDQQLLADILGGGGSVYSRRADGRNYYEVGPQPVDLLGGFILPGLPQGSIAMEAILWGTLENRSFKVSCAIDEAGVTNLQAALDLAGDPVPAPGRVARYTNPLLALPSTGLLRQLELQSLEDARWLGANFVLLRADGTLERVQLARDASGWASVETSVETQFERLEKLRDERLDFLRLLATSYERVSGRWPRGLHEISFLKYQLNDPVSPAGRLGWADYDKKPPAGLALAETADGAYAVITTHAGAQGRRAVTRDGQYVWVR